jgi:hypothetical protein
LAKDPQYIDELIRLGSRSTPTTVVERDDGTRELIIGFHQAELEKVLGL